MEARELFDCEYEFDIEYFKGRQNMVADALSRRLDTLSFMSIALY